jgi:hypothetical protein
MSLVKLFSEQKYDVFSVRYELNIHMSSSSDSLSTSLIQVRTNKLCSFVALLHTAISLSTTKSLHFKQHYYILSEYA